MSDETVEIAFDTLVHETQAAVLLDFGDQEVWVPKSLIDPIDEDAHVVDIPEWFALREGLI